MKMGAKTGERSPNVSSEDELLLSRANQEEQGLVEDKRRDPRFVRLLGVVLSISGLLLVTLLAVIMNSRSTVELRPFELRAGHRGLTMKEPISLREVLTGELMGKSFEATWLIEQRTGRDQLLFKARSGDLHLATIGNDKSSIDSPERPYDLPIDQSGDNHLSGLPSVKIPLASNPKLKSINYETWKLSPGRRFLLLATNLRQRFRASFTAEYFIYDTILDSLRKLETQASRDIATGSRAYFGEQLASPSERPVRFQLADWFTGPSGQDSLLLAQDGDLYVLKDIVGRSQQSTEGENYRWRPERLTFTGRPGTVYNGLSDWLYEEQLTGGKPAYAISPAGSQYLAYLSFNDSRVSEIPMVLLDDNTPSLNNVRLRFPTAGTPIASVRLHLIENFASDATRRARQVPIELPEELTREQHLLFHANWLTRDKLSLLWYNRHRSESHVLICSRQMALANSTSAAWTCERSSSAKAPPNGWLDARKPPTRLNDEFYLILVPKFEGADVGEFTHLAQVSLERPNELVFLTSGRKEVLEIEGVDRENSLVYYTATGVGKPGERHLYVTSLQLSPGELDTANSQDDTCLTCDLYPDRHLYFEVKLSDTASHMILNCNGPDIPRIELRKLLHARDGAAFKTTTRLVRTIEDNRMVRMKVERVKSMPVEVRLRLPIKNTEYEASVLLLLPPLAEFEREQFSDTPTDSTRGRDGGAELIQRYIERMRTVDTRGPVPPFPMVVDVYGGPATFTKTGQEYNVTWGHWYASNRRTVYAWIEGRGSGFEGTRRLYELFGRLGTVEIEDQIQVTRDLVQGPLARLVDPARVGIWGWSYGGYAAGMVLARDGAQAGQTNPGVFACGGSFGAVTDWLHYDTLYSEMLLRSPWKNERYDRHTLGDHHLLPSLDVGSSNSSSSYIDRSRATNTLRDDVNDRYRNSSLIEQAQHIRGKRYLLVSGLADDNVHIQHTLRLTERLVAEGIPFEMAFYPNQRHSMNYNLATRMHMHTRLADFFARCFSKVATNRLAERANYS